MNAEPRDESSGSGFRPQWLRLERLSFSARSPDQFDRTKPLDAPAFTIDATGIVDSGSKSIQMRLAVVGRSRPESTSPFEIEATLVALFAWAEPVSVSPEQFAERNAVAILWPYCREIVSNLSARSGFPGYFLPILNFTTAKVSVQPAAQRD